MVNGKRYESVAFFLKQQAAMRISKPLILASRSPRRSTLLRQIGMTPDVQPCEIPEDLDPQRAPAENAMSLALLKAETVGERVTHGIVVGADTIVVIDGEMLGKPADRADAVRMLQTLSGKTHTVYTGYALLDKPSGRSVTGFEATRVTFRQLLPDEIEEYVDTGAPMDKAGAYGIQDDYSVIFVTRIDGCFYNVVGFPIAAFYTTLQEFQRQLAI
jgi:septum formation protein